MSNNKYSFSISCSSLLMLLSIAGLVIYIINYNTYVVPYQNNINNLEYELEYKYLMEWLKNVYIVSIASFACIGFIMVFSCCAMCLFLYNENAMIFPYILSIIVTMVFFGVKSWLVSESVPLYTYSQECRSNTTTCTTINTGTIIAEFIILYVLYAVSVLNVIIILCSLCCLPAVHE